MKRTARSNQILVPLIEDFMRTPIEIDDDLDREFITKLVEARSQPRKKGVYSPSALAACVRKVYFMKSGQKQFPVQRVEMSGYFFDGNWRHFKWQYCLWKMHRAGIIQLLDVGSMCIGTEVYVHNERGDFGGTIDNVVYVPSKNFLCTIDWKGMNGNSFNKYVAFGPPLLYAMQSVGYAGLANSSLKMYDPASYDPNHPPEAQESAKRIKINDILIIGENKNGPIFNRKVKSPLGLYEWHITLDKYQPAIADRLKKLRSYERRRETPPPECVSTKRRDFKDCAFAPICRGEIERIEKRKVRLDRKRVTKKKTTATPVLGRVVKRKSTKPGSKK